MLMANQEQQRQSQGNTMMRRGVNPTGLLLAPGDLFRMNPFSLMRRMSEEMDRVFGEFGLNRGNEGSTVFAPPIEVSQKDGTYQVRAELPGVKPSDVKLEVTEDTVILEGDRIADKQEKKGGMEISERIYGHFYRAIPLPEGAKVDQAKANFDNGVLEVTIPVEEPKEKRRQIPISSAAPAKSGTTEKAA